MEDNIPIKCAPGRPKGSKNANSDAGKKSKNGTNAVGSNANSKKGTKHVVSLKDYDRLSKPFKISHINAAKNILRGKISINRSCLSQRSVDELIIGVNAYLFNHKDILENKELNLIIKTVMNCEHQRVTDAVKFFYLLVKKMVADGEELNLEPLRIVAKDKTLDNTLILCKGLRDRNVKLNVIIREKDELENVKAYLEALQQKHVDLINNLIEEQKQLSDDYFSNHVPYHKVRHRRYDFEVKNQRKTTDGYISELRGVYGDELDYSDVNYINSKTLISLRCKKHDLPFTRMPLSLLKGWGCPLCNKEQGKTWANTISATYDPARKSERWTTKRFIKESVKMFGEGVFNYSKCRYKNNDEPVILIRVKDGKEISVRPYEHLRHEEGWDGERRFYEGKTNMEKIHYIVKKVHECLEHKVYVPYQEISNTKSNIRFVCPLHDEFYSNMNQIRNGQCCPECTKRGESIGERNVRRYLSEKGIEFIQEYYIKDKEYFENHARPDFYLPQCNTFIEFQGEHHYGIDVRPYLLKKKTQDQQYERDDAMRRYAADHNIRLIEIPYQYRQNIDEYLDNYELS